MTDESDKAKKAAFDALFAAEKAVKDAEAELTRSMKQIVEEYGNGPWRYQGRDFSIGRRKDAFFLKGINERSIETIE